MPLTHRFSDWRGLRRALGLTQEEMSKLLGVSLGTVGYMERKAKRPARRQTINQLRVVLMEPDVQEILKKAGYPHPFPDDVKPIPPPEPAKAPAKEQRGLRWPKIF